MSTVVTVLLFELSGVRYAVKAELVSQVVWLPQLTPVDEMAHYHRGIFNLQGQVVEVVDLNLRLGHPSEPCSSSHCVVILSLQQGLVGVIANDVAEVVELELLEQPTDESGPQQHVITARAEYRQQMVMLLDEEQLLPRFNHVTDQLIERQPFCPDLEAAEQSVLQQRADHYRLQEEKRAHLQRHEVVIATIGGEYFGLMMGNGIQEFAEMDEIEPIPCTPPHVIGNMNLRGELVTLFDISTFIGLPATDHDTPQNLIVYPVEGLLLGVLVDEIHNVISLTADQVHPVPIALEEGERGFSRGEFSYRQQMTTLLDLIQMIEQGELEVNEVVQ